MNLLRRIFKFLFLTGWLAPFLGGLNFWAGRGCEQTLQCSFPFTATAIKLFIISAIWLFFIALWLWRTKTKNRPS